MNQQIHTSGTEETFVLAVTVAAKDRQVLREAPVMRRENQAANVLPDLNALQGHAGIAALYWQMANVVRSISGD